VSYNTISSSKYRVLVSDGDLFLELAPAAHQIYLFQNFLYLGLVAGVLLLIIVFFILRRVKILQKKVHKYVQIN